MLVRLVFGVALAGFCFAAEGSSGTSIEILSPTNEARFAEFSSPAFKVRIANSDGTLRLYEGPPNTNSPGSMADLLLFTNVPTTSVVDLPLTNLAPGTYTFGLTIREPGGEYRLFPAMVTFTVTNRVRAIPKYMMVALPGGTNTRPAKINNKGQVVGVSGGKAFLFENGVMRSLGTLGGSYSEATAINNNWQVVGVADDGEGIRRPFLWEEARGMVRMPINRDPTPTDINDLGDVVGSGADGGFLYRSGHGFGAAGWPTDINNRGYTAAGGIQSTDAIPMWDEFFRIGAYVFGEDGVNVQATAINDANEVTGTDISVVGGGRWASQYVFRYHGYKRERVSPSRAFSWPSAINRMGDIVGYLRPVDYMERGSVDSFGPPRGFLATREGFRELNEIVVDRGTNDVTKAFSINDRREIVGLVKIDGVEQGVLLRPIPAFQGAALSSDGKVKARVDGFNGMKVRVERSADFREWLKVNSYELSDADLDIEMTGQGGAEYLRVVLE